MLDPRVNYLMVNMLEEVMRTGTAAGVRGLGFTVPAAGKTGTSHDGWFAGFTSELLCVVWVGFDDNRTIDLEGAHSALPIWTELMKRALLLREYRSAKPFPAAGRRRLGRYRSRIRHAAPPRPAPIPAPKYSSPAPNLWASCPLHGGNGQGDTTHVSGWDAHGDAAAEPQHPERTKSQRRRRASSRSFGCG